jgi:hypothetical protein
VIYLFLLRTPSFTSLPDAAYRSQSDGDVKERILLVRPVMSDGKEVANVCVKKSCIDQSLGLTNGGLPDSKNRVWMA